MPLLLCKLLGGFMAIIGLPGAVFISTRRANVTLPDVLPYVLTGLAGIVIFIASSRALAKRFGDNGNQTLAMKDKKRMNIMSWTILLILATVFLLFTYFMARR